MKKIIRQILDDLNPRSKNSFPIDSSKPSDYSIPAADQSNNELAIKVTDAQPDSPNLGNLDQNPQYQAPLPQDLSNQILSKDPAQLVKQLDYQAHESEVEQTS